MKKKPIAKIGIAIRTLTAGIFAINKFIEHTSIKKRLLCRNEKNYYNWKLGRICYTIHGSGSPVLLIHDSIPCCSTHEWDAIIDNLSKNHTVYCMDLLGCGCSDRPKITYTNYLYVQLINDFIKNIIKEKTDIVTSGLSGIHALMACKNDDSQIGKLIMINPEDLAVLAKTPTWKTKILKAFIEIPVFGTCIYNIVAAKGNLELLFTERYLYNPFHLDYSVLDYYYETAHLANGNGKYLYSSLKGNFLYMNIAGALKTIKTPIYILEGEGESHSKEIVELYKVLNPRIHCEFLSKNKHIPHIESPDTISKLLHKIL